MNPGVPMRQAAAELASLQPLQPPRSTPAGAASSHPHHAGEESPGFGREAAPGRCPPARRRHGAPCAPRCSPPRPMIGCACVLAWPLPSDRASSRRGSRPDACLRILIPTSTVRGQWGSAMPACGPAAPRGGGPADGHPAPLRGCRGPWHYHHFSGPLRPTLPSWPCCPHRSPREPDRPRPGQALRNGASRVRSSGPMTPAGSRVRVAAAHREDPGCAGAMTLVPMAR